MSVEFKDFSIQVKTAMKDIAPAILEEVAGELEAQVKRNTRVDSGKTKNSWTHNVEVSDDVSTATIGSPDENAIWEEFGTGEYALNGNGRKGGWVYYQDNGHKVTYNKDGSIRKNSKYKSAGNFIFTLGKKPSRAFWNAYNSKKNKLIKRIQDAFKGGLS